MAEALQPFVCGGLSAMFASAVIHPIDLTKVRIQLVGQGSKEAAPSARAMVQQIVRAEGVKGLYSGLTAALTRQVGSIEAYLRSSNVNTFKTFCDLL